jgi:orotidine-5'-phosphate decarboxylase
MPTELITVLDVDTRDEALQIAEAVGGCPWLKVGAQLFTREGPEVVRALQEQGKRLFLDLKYHDIPNTVAAAARAAAELGVELFTVHAAGGRAMIAAAREAVEGTQARILAVTVLTSLSAEALRDEVGMSDPPEAAVRRLGQLAVESGAHGLVCSPLELEALRAAVGSEPTLVTPGVRPAWASTDDQARVMTPAEAAEAGSDFIVVGRPILRHTDPAAAVRRIQDELQGAAGATP